MADSMISQGTTNLLHFDHVLGFFVQLFVSARFEEITEYNWRALVKDLFFRPRHLNNQQIDHEAGYVGWGAVSLVHRGD